MTFNSKCRSIGYFGQEAVGNQQQHETASLTANSAACLFQRVKSAFRDLVRVASHSLKIVFDSSHVATDFFVRGYASRQDDLHGRGFPCQPRRHFLPRYLAAPYLLAILAKPILALIRPGSLEAWPFRS
jgi:hypothetical protein